MKNHTFPRKSRRPCREFQACNSPNDFDARRLYISTLDFRWTMRWVMAWYFRRKSFSEPVDSAESLLAPPDWGSSSSPHSPLLSSVKYEKYTPYIMFRKEHRGNTWFKIFEILYYWNDTWSCVWVFNVLSTNKMKLWDLKYLIMMSSCTCIKDTIKQTRGWQSENMLKFVTYMARTLTSKGMQVSLSFSYLFVFIVV
jgi:hypothetical protein